MSKHRKHSHSGKHRKKARVRKLLKGIGLVLLLLILFVAGFLGYLTLVEYKPADRERVEVEARASRTLQAGQEITVMTWNTGYGALGDNADFFMDGGRMVNTADISRVTDNLAGIRQAAGEVSPDILFLQEVDSSSDRSHHIDETRYYEKEFPSLDAAYALNFKVFYIPYPVPPIGRVESGLQTLSAYMMEEAERIQLPCPFSWPVRLANLKRCLLISRLPIEGSDRKLVLINLHLEAYDDGAGKEAQTEMLRQVLEEEAAAGNYVIAGGDFNQIFSNADDTRYQAQEGKWQAGKIDVEAFSGDWTFLMDDTVPSCRSLDQPYLDADQGSFQYYLIDGFIVSDNLEVESLGGVDLGFVHTDHNPVVLTARLGD